MKFQSFTTQTIFHTHPELLFSVRSTPRLSLTPKPATTTTGFYIGRLESNTKIGFLGTFFPILSKCLKIGGTRTMIYRRFPILKIEQFSSSLYPFCQSFEIFLKCLLNSYLSLFVQCLHKCYQFHSGWYELLRKFIHTFHSSTVKSLEKKVNKKTKTKNSIHFSENLLTQAPHD